MWVWHNPSIPGPYPPRKRGKGSNALIPMIFATSRLYQAFITTVRRATIAAHHRTWKPDFPDGKLENPTTITTHPDRRSRLLADGSLLAIAAVWGATFFMVKDATS